MYALTEKSRDLIKTKVFGGKLYALMQKDQEKEIWISGFIPKVPNCPLCGYMGFSMEEHHIYGRKNSDETIKICANCHREIHK